MAIHVAQDEEEYEEVAQGEPCGVIVAEAWGESVAYGADDAAEVDYLAQEIGCDCVHAVDFEPVEAAGVSPAVDEIIERGHEQEADAA